MPTIKRYKIEWDDIAEVIVDVDHDIMTEKELREINEFWMSAKWREQHHGGPLNAVLSMLAAVVIRLQFENDYSIEHLITQFDWEAGRGVEGWPPMDGSHGIEIIDTTDIELDSHNMDVSEIPYPEKTSETEAK